jgi:hypothetical protein
VTNWRVSEVSLPTTCHAEVVHTHDITLHSRQFLVTRRSHRTGCLDAAITPTFPTQSPPPELRDEDVVDDLLRDISTSELRQGLLLVRQIDGLLSWRILLRDDELEVRPDGLHLLDVREVLEIVTCDRRWFLER